MGNMSLGIYRRKSMLLKYLADIVIEQKVDGVTVFTIKM